MERNTAQQGDMASKLDKRSVVWSERGAVLGVDPPTQYYCALTHTYKH